MAEEHDVHFDSADAGASLTYPQQAGTIRKNGFIVIKNRPCKVPDPISHTALARRQLVLRIPADHASATTTCNPAIVPRAASLRPASIGAEASFIAEHRTETSRALMHGMRVDFGLISVPGRAGGGRFDLQDRKARSRQVPLRRCGYLHRKEV